MSDYITKEDTIIFSPEWNGPLDIELLSNYKKLIFSNYELNYNLFEKYELSDDLFEKFFNQFNFW